MSRPGPQPAPAPEPGRGWQPSPSAESAELQLHRGDAGHAYYGAPASVSVHPTQIIVLAAPKSAVLAAALTMMLGPFGMLYSTVTGAVTTIVVGLVFASLEFGPGLVVTLAVGVVWAAAAARQHNSRLVRRYLSGDW